MGRLRRVLLLLLAATSAALAPYARSQSILTVAGGGTDDGRLATAAGLTPRAVAVDAAGNIFIADNGNQRIRRVDAATGIISTVAGDGSSTFSGDGGPATAAGLNSPQGIAVDVAGRILIADNRNRRIRRVDSATGVITTIAGGGSGGDGGPATAAGLGLPADVALDASGNILVADEAAHRIRRIDAVTGIISTVAGNGFATYSGDGGLATAAALYDPRGVAADAEGNVLIADSGNGRVRRVDARTGTISTVAGNGSRAFSGDGGPATAAALNLPEGVEVDAAGNILIADSDNQRIRRVDATTGIISTFAGTGTRAFSGDGGPATAAALSAPGRVALDPSGNILIADEGNRRVRRVDRRTQVISTVAGDGTNAFYGDGGPATAAALRDPSGVAVGALGSILVSDGLNLRVRRVDTATGTISTVAGGGSVFGEGGPATAASFSRPFGIAIDTAGNILIVDFGRHRIRRVDAATGIISTVAGSGSLGFSGDGGPATAAALNSPEGVAVDVAGNILIADTGNSRVRRVDGRTGIMFTIAGNGIPSFFGDGGPATAAALHEPAGVAVDGAGGVLIADTHNHRIRRVDAATGTISTVAGNGTNAFFGDGGPATAAGLSLPYGVTVDAAGNLLVADMANHRIRRVDATTGVISTVAGNGTKSFAGDGGQATAATLAAPYGVAVDPAGNIFIADTWNHRVRAVFACVTVAPPSLSAPADGATGVSTGPTLSWSSVPGAFRYDVSLGTTSPPTTVVASDLVATSFTASNLLPGTTYSWKVVAKGDPFCVPPSSAESAIRPFTTAAGCAAPSTPVLLSPADGATGLSSTVTLSWSPTAGAGSYDVYLGASGFSAPTLTASGLTGTTWTATALVPGALYSWYVLARAACDPGKTSTAATRSFGVAGTTCLPPGAFSLSSPADGATGVPPDTTLSWTPSANATSYDLYLGTSSPPPLHRPGLASTSLALRGLPAGASYRWKVIARTSCDPGLSFATPVRSFTVRGTCAPPGSSSFTFVPPGNVGTGQTYVVAWSTASDLDRGGGYVVQRSTSSSFSPVLDTVTTSSLFASFVAPSPGSLYHRVRAVPACDPAKAGPWSPTGLVSVVSARPNVVFSRTPEAVVTVLGESLEDLRTPIALENLTSSPLPLFLGRQEIASVPFFTLHDPAGGDAALVTLEPKVPKTLELHYSGPPNDVAGSYQGIIFAAGVGAGLAVTPWAFVSLKVGSSPDAVPQFRFNGVATEYAAFPGLSGPDDGRAPLSVDIHNPGSSPLELAAVVGPEVWLNLEPGWNASPIPPGGSRTLRLSTRRVRAPNGSALPRYTYVTLRTKGGVTSRLLVQDNEAPLLSSGRGASAVRPEASFLVPSVAHVTSALGNTFVSKVALSNAGTEAVQAELVFTPASSDSALVDGFDASAIKRATVLVPPNDVVRLSDPLVLLFGLAPPVSGTLEVRAAAERAGFLSVASSVDAPASGGGSFGFALPVFRSGEGIRAGSSAAITAVASDAAERTNLILAETTGVDEARVRVSLYHASGALRGSETVTVPRWGQRQLSGVVQRLGGASGARAGRIEVAVESGGGTLAAVTTVVDNANDDAAAFAARAVETQGSAAKAVRALAPAWAKASGTVKSLVPALVNGYQTFPASAAPFTFRSVLGFSNIASTEALFRLTYYDLTSGATIVREVRVPDRGSVEYTNALEQLFGIAPGAKSQGPLFVESDPQGQLWCRVASSLAKGTIGDSFPVIPVPSEGLTGGKDARLIALDNLEQSLDRSRGTRSNLLLNEVAGKPVTLLVSLYEAGNRSSPIATRELSLKPLEKLQLSTVFAELGLESEERRKDRTGVLCTVRAFSGEGLASAVVTTIDNKTGDTRNTLLAPTSAGAPGVSIEF